MMLVIVIVAVLALVATVAYRKWVRSSYMSEAQEMLQNIRSAEENFKAENGGYLNVSTDLSQTSLYPSTTPSAAITTVWGADPGWAALTILPSAPVRFGYALVAGAAGTAPPTIAVNGTNVDLTALSSAPWFVAVAMCDEDVDTSTPPTAVYAISSDGRLRVSNEGQ